MGRPKESDLYRAPAITIIIFVPVGSFAMGDWKYRGERRQFAMSAMWLGLVAVAVGVPAYLAATVWIQCPPSYGYPPGVLSCREVENTSLFAGLLVLLSGATAFVGAALGLVALLRRERPLPALLPIAIAAVLLVNWILRWRN